MARGAPVDRRAAATHVLRYVRPDLERAQFFDEVGGIVAPVRAERDRLGPVCEGLDHLEGSQPFGMTLHAGEPGIDEQARAVLHEAVAEEAQLRLHARALLVEHRIGIGAARMGGVRALLPVKIGGRIAAAAVSCAVVPIIILLRTKALHARLGFDERAIDAEMLTREQLAHTRLLEDRDQKLRRDFPCQQPVAVLGKGRMVPHRLVDAEPHEPAEQ